MKFGSGRIVGAFSRIGCDRCVTHLVVKLKIIRTLRLPVGLFEIPEITDDIMCQPLYRELEPLDGVVMACKELIQSFLSYIGLFLGILARNACKLCE